MDDETKPLLSGQWHQKQLELFLQGALWAKVDGVVFSRAGEPLEPRQLVAIGSELATALQCQAAVQLGATLSHGLSVGVARCPWCQAGVKWACGAEVGEAGSIDCQDGTNVSRRMSKDGHEARGGSPPPCHWPGATCQRVRDDADPGAVIVVQDGAFSRARKLESAGAELEHLLRQAGRIR
jgi:hypothetical protein